jgi:uncharacterized membrane protein YhhN
VYVDAFVMFGVLCAYMKLVFIGPVLVYCLALACVVYKAAARNTNHYSLASVQLSVVGAVCFLASDSTLAFTKFVGDFNGSEFVVMVTYYVAQGCLGLAASTLAAETWPNGVISLQRWSVHDSNRQSKDLPGLLISDEFYAEVS